MSKNRRVHDQMNDENGAGGPAFLKEGPDLSGRTNVRRPPAPNVNAAS